MTKMIHDYSAAGTIDAAADYLLIDPASSGVYKKINRNTLLGLSSAPLGLTDSQTVSNKVYNNTNSFTAKDGSLTLQNTADTTKQAVFSAASITTGQTRTFTFPDASGTLATIAGTQTLTNKTITSPAISGGTIDNAAITVDSISGHTTSTTVTVANLQILNGALNTANSVTATSIADNAIQPKALVSGTGSGWSYVSYTPSWTNFTVGNGTVVASYCQTGKTVDGKILVTLGSTSVMSTQPKFSLPVTANPNAYGGDKSPLGTISLNHTGTGEWFGAVKYSSTTVAVMWTLSSAGTDTQYVNVDSTTPFTWTNGDIIGIQFRYEAA